MTETKMAGPWIKLEPCKDKRITDPDHTERIHRVVLYGGGNTSARYDLGFSYRIAAIVYLERCRYRLEVASEYSHYLCLENAHYKTQEEAVATADTYLIANSWILLTEAQANLI